MNKKQLRFCMWLRTPLIVVSCVSLFLLWYGYRGFWVGTFIVAPIILGLIIITFIREKSPAEQNLKVKAMNWKGGLNRVTFVMAIISGIVCGIGGALRPIDIHSQAKEEWWAFSPLVVKEPNEQEVEEFNEWAEEMAARCIIIDANYYVIDSTANSVRADLPSLGEIRETILKHAKSRLWRDLSFPKLVLFCILYGLLYALAGYGVIWLVYLLCWVGIYTPVKWVAFGFIEPEKTNKE